MIPALYILGFTILVGLILYIGEIHWRRTHPVQKPDATGNAASQSESESDAPTEGAQNGGEVVGNGEGECCGLHLVCEKDSLSPVSDEILYYDDEELDRFIGRTPESYTPEETEEFRDVLMTLLPKDVAGWARSITQRRLELPPEVRDELLMLVNEQRRQNQSALS